jgi:protein SCO1/2
MSLIAGLGLAWLSTASLAATAGGDFELTDQNGEPWSTTSARGQVVLLSFGYTFCPDICPTTLATMNAALRQLGADAAEVQPVFVSLDPERDTPERLREYVNWFNPRLIGLTGSAETLAQVADRYRVRYALVQATDADYYTLDHSASLYLLDRQGELARMLPHGLPTDALVSAIEDLLHEDAAAPAQ